MKSMKAMKMAMKAMKMAMAMKMGMKKMAMKKKITGKKASVFHGTKVKTVGGLKKTDLKKNKSGKIVSKKASDAAKKRKSYKKILAWNAAMMKARKQLGLKGFVKCKKGSKLYAATK